MWTVTRCFRFEAAHRLPNHEGKCKNLHGHSYVVEIAIKGKELYKDASEHGHRISETEMLMDFGTIKKVWQEDFGHLDHSVLNDYFTYPTAEQIAHRIFHQLRASLEGYLEGAELSSVKVQETEDCWAEYNKP